MSQNWEATIFLRGFNYSVLVYGCSGFLLSGVFLILRGLRWQLSAQKICAFSATHFSLELAASNAVSSCHNTSHVTLLSASAFSSLSLRLLAAHEYDVVATTASLELLIVVSPERDCCVCWFRITEVELHLFCVIYYIELVHLPLFLTLAQSLYTNNLFNKPCFRQYVMARLFSSLGACSNNFITSVSVLFIFPYLTRPHVRPSVSAFATFGHHVRFL